MNHKLVSVIIPTYNRADSVVEAIRSVRAQSYPAVQIIVADDGSKDETARNVAQFEDVEYYYQENKGQGAARNLGLKHARGEYIASLDSDDIWDKEFLSVAVGGIERHEADFVFLNWTEISEKKKSASDWERSNLWQKYSFDPRDEWSFLNAAQVRELFLKSCPAPSSALLIRRSSFVSQWNEHMRIADDWFLILEMVLSKPCRAAFTISPYWTKYVHNTNIYHGREKLEVLRDLGMHDEVLFAVYFRELLTAAEMGLLKQRLASHHFNFGRLNWKREGFSRSSLQSIVTAFRLAPFNSVFYIMQLSYFHLKNRYQVARRKAENSLET